MLDKWHKFVELVAVGLLMVMFSAFLVQIFMRYVMNNPLGWTLEACVILYIWTVFWTSAFLTDESDHITFTILLDSVQPRVRRIMLIVGHIVLGGAFISALPAVVDYVAFMKINSTPIAHLRFDFVFSIFVVFMVAVVIRSIRMAYRRFSNRDKAATSVNVER